MMKMLIDRGADVNLRYTIGLVGTASLFTWEAMWYVVTKRIKC